MDRKEYDKRKYNQDITLSRKMKRENYRKNSEKILKRRKELHPGPQKERLAPGYHVIRRRNIKYTVLKHYSGGKEPFCTCCGCNILEYLSIDHIQGRGTEERKETKNGVMYSLIKRKFPTGYQVLCVVCNTSKGKNKECEYHKFIPSSFKK